jgi:hypothetical protein
MLITERPSTYVAPSPRTAGRIDARAALKTGATTPAANSNPSSAGTGRWGMAISRKSSADETSHKIISRLTGIRSTRPDSSAPPNRKGTNPIV